MAGYAIVVSLVAWFVGMVLDANIWDGFMCLRVVLPVIVMGAFVLRALSSRNKD